ncbi:hypothetical protein OG216_36570 [Streptomycetaceae bacterium NBC_01309]
MEPDEVAGCCDVVSVSSVVEGGGYFVDGGPVLLGMTAVPLATGGGGSSPPAPGFVAPVGRRVAVAWPVPSVDGASSDGVTRGSPTFGSPGASGFDVQPTITVIARATTTK